MVLAVLPCLRGRCGCRQGVHALLAASAASARGFRALSCSEDRRCCVRQLVCPFVKLCSVQALLLLSDSSQHMVCVPGLLLLSSRMVATAAKFAVAAVLYLLYNLIRIPIDRSN